MTLIAAINSADALVIAADKRITTRAGHSDDVTKIIQVGDMALGSAYHSVRHEEPGTGVVRFDVYKLMAAHFAANPFSAASLGTFEGHLIAKFSEYRKTYKITSLPARKGHPVFKLAFFAREGEIFRRNHREFRIKEDGILSQTGENKPCPYGGVQLFGDGGLIVELTEGKNKVFDDLRADPEVKQLVLEREAQPIGAVTTAQARAFCARLIQACYNKCVLLKLSKIPISKTYDLAVIDATGVHFGQ